MTLHIPEACLKGVDQLVEDGLYPNRSEVIRTAIRDLLRRELWAPRQREYDHRGRPMISDDLAI
ncbi:MAG: ribbon-helix-helix domain-containing protein [Candidatus Ranarchaeia archaeon]